MVRSTSDLSLPARFVSVTLVTRIVYGAETLKSRKQSFRLSMIRKNVSPKTDFLSSFFVDSAKQAATRVKPWHL